MIGGVSGPDTRGSSGRLQGTGRGTHASDFVYFDCCFSSSDAKIGLADFAYDVSLVPLDSSLHVQFLSEGNPAIYDSNTVLQSVTDIF
jgi:hypothetical protein